MMDSAVLEAVAELVTREEWSDAARAKAREARERKAKGLGIDLWKADRVRAGEGQPGDQWHHDAAAQHGLLDDPSPPPRTPPRETDAAWALRQRRLARRQRRR